LWLQSCNGSQSMFTKNCCKIHDQIECYFQVTVDHRGRLKKYPLSLFENCCINADEKKPYHVSTKSPWYLIHLFHQGTRLCIPWEKNVFGCVKSWMHHSFTSFSFANQHPLSVIFTTQKRQKSDGTRSGL
jgi:hypothetical protein